MLTETQIFYLRIAAVANLKDENSDAGEIWAQILASVESSPSFRRLYWGRSVEHPEQVQLHIVRASAKCHARYLQSAEYAALQRLFQQLTMQLPTVRHVAFEQFTASLSPIAAPFTGTAIYLDCQPDLWEAAWKLWTHVVPSVNGNRGIIGGWVREDVKGRPNGYLVYVGWDSIKQHDDFHHTDEFRRKGVILGLGNEGWTEYGHVKFEEERSQGTRINSSSRL